MPRYRHSHLFQLREIALGLTFIGGFIDAYTFGQRGGVLAAGQTGNIIFLSVNIAQRDYLGVLTKGLTILFFIIGIALVGVLKRTLGAHTHYWRITTLIAELVICILVGWLPKNISNMIVSPPLALVMAMQTAAFSHIEGHGYNNVFSTGNLKNATIAFTNYSLTHDHSELTTAIIYGTLVLSFAGGAVVSALLQPHFAAQTIWLVAGPLLLVAGYYITLLHQRAIETD